MQEARLHLEGSVHRHAVLKLSRMESASSVSAIANVDALSLSTSQPSTSQSQPPSSDLDSKGIHARLEARFLIFKQVLLS